MNEQERNELERLPNLLPWVVGIAALLLVGAYVWAFNQLPSRESPPAWGSFGDYVGGILNPLVSAFTLIVAVKVWRHQKVELAESKKALKQQAKTAEQQRQEQRFFDLLRVLQRVEDSISLTSVPKGGTLGDARSYRSKAAIAKWVEDLPREFGLTLRHGLGQALDSGATVTKSKLQDTWRQQKYGEYFAPYLRMIYRLLSDAEDLLGDQNYKYVKLLRSQLTSGELKLIALALWLDADWAKLAPKVEQYGLLKHLSDSAWRRQLEADLPLSVFGRTTAMQLSQY